MRAIHNEKTGVHFNSITVYHICFSLFCPVDRYQVLLLDEIFVPPLAEDGEGATAAAARSSSFRIFNDFPFLVMRKLRGILIYEKANSKIPR